MARPGTDHEMSLCSRQGDNSPREKDLSLAELEATEEKNDLTTPTLEDEVDFTPEQERKLLRKIDLHLVPVMMAIYGMQWADKLSLTNGVLFGLREDTRLRGQQYPWLTTIFYLGFLIFQPIVNYAMQRVNAGKFLAGLVVVWGAVVMALAACNNFAQLMVARFILGGLEGATTPALIIIVASWYRQPEQNTRQLLYLSMNSGFALWITLVIYFLAKRSEESGGMSGWRVINLFLGALTIFVGLIACVLLRLPSDAWWLNEREKKAARARIVDNSTGGGETAKWNWQHVADAFRDPNTYFLFVLCLSASIPNGGITTFQAVIFKSFGFTPLESILYQLPQFALALCWIIFGLLMLRAFPRLRFFFMTVSLVPGFVAVLTVGLLPTSPSYKWIKYGVYVMAIMSSLHGFIVWSFMPAIIGGRTKKTVVSATTFIGYCLGNMIGPQVFRAKDAPHYTPGLIVTGSMIGFVFVLCMLWLWYLVRENARRRKKIAAIGISEEERLLKSKVNGELDMTDNRNIYFLYPW